MTVYNVTLTTLTPLHIGDGDELRQDFDFAVWKGATYRLDEDAVLRAKANELAPDRRGAYPLPGSLLTEADFANPALFRYRLAGSPRSHKTDARVKSFIKDIHDRPYVPGSSLKGALRTALAWTGWPEVKPRLDRAAVGRSRSWAGQLLERKLFGPNPNHDLLRALHVADLAGPERAGEGLVLVNAQVLTKKSAGSPVELEAVKGDTVLRGTLTIDETLFGPLAEPELHFGNRRHWLAELTARAQAHSLARIQELAEWYETAEGGEAVGRFYRQLLNARVGANAALLQIGWGAGWDGKTFWTHLQQDAPLFEQLVTDYRLHRAAPGSPPRRAGDPFPRSKRAAMVVKDGVARAAAPFGWVLLTLEPVGGAAPQAAALSRPAEAQLPARASAPAPEARQPAAPVPPPAKPAPPPPPPAAKKPAAAPKRPLSETFSALPAVGDRFRGTVLDTEPDGTIYVELPGLSADDLAMGVIVAENNPEGRKFKEGATVTCEVLAVDPDPAQAGHWLVRCRRE